VNPETSGDGKWQQAMRDFHTKGTGGILIFEAAGPDRFFIDTVMRTYGKKPFNPLFVSFGFDDANDKFQLLKERILKREDHPTLGSKAEESQIQEAFSSAKTAFFKIKDPGKEQGKEFFDQIRQTTGNFLEVPFDLSVEEKQAAMLDKIAFDANKAAPVVASEVDKSAEVVAAVPAEQLADIKNKVYSYQQPDTVLSYTAIKLDEDTKGRIFDLAEQHGVKHAAQLSPSLHRTVNFFRRVDWTPAKEEAFLAGITEPGKIGTNQDIKIIGFVYNEQGSAAITVDDIKGRGHLTLSHSGKPFLLDQLVKQAEENPVPEGITVVMLPEPVTVQGSYEPAFAQPGGAPKAPKAGQNPKAGQKGKAKANG